MMDKPWPKTKDELERYVLEQFEYAKAAESPDEGYNRTAEIVSNITVATFNFYASEVGITGFQAGWAQMNFLRQVRNLEAPFMLLDASKLLYTQYDIQEEVDEFVEGSKPALAEMARQKLNESGNHAHPNVVARWKEIADM